MNNQNIEDKALTTLAFVIGLALIDNLSSTEQNAVGNWIMLIAQTLCTNGSYTFNKEWKGHINNSNTPVTKDALEKVGDIINNTIKNIISCTILFLHRLLFWKPFTTQSL